MEEVACLLAKNVAVKLLNLEWSFVWKMDPSFCPMPPDTEMGEGGGQQIE